MITIQKEEKAPDELIAKIKAAKLTADDFAEVGRQFSLSGPTLYHLAIGSARFGKTDIAYTRQTGAIKALLAYAMRRMKETVDEIQEVLSSLKIAA